MGEYLNGSWGSFKSDLSTAITNAPTRREST